MNYYISDLHFGCQNKYEGRTLDHDKLIKENWNKTVTNGDTVYILGDIGREGGNKEKKPNSIMMFSDCETLTNIVFEDYAFADFEGLFTMESI